ncbi:hypothetical protein ACOME3_001750 [Neoechinorhynchus agilis]
MKQDEVQNGYIAFDSDVFNCSEVKVHKKNVRTNLSPESSTEMPLNTTTTDSNVIASDLSKIARKKELYAYKTFRDLEKWSDANYDIIYYVMIGVCLLIFYLYAVFGRQLVSRNFIQMKGKHNYTKSLYF